MPALPLDDAGPYVAAAYLVFLALILIYVAIMATRLSRLERDLGELAELAERRAEREREAEEGVRVAYEALRASHGQGRTRGGTPS